MRVTVLGATGLVGEELLQILGEREFPVGELRCFGSSDDSGDFGAPAGLEFRGSEVVAEPTDASRIADSDLVFCAAPGALEPLLPAIRESGAARRSRRPTATPTLTPWRASTPPSPTAAS